jgi:hypothetical protein
MKEKNVLPETCFSLHMFFILYDVHPQGLERSLDPLEVLGNLAAPVWCGATLAGGLGAALGPGENWTRYAARVFRALAEASAAKVAYR